MCVCMSFCFSVYLYVYVYVLRQMLVTQLMYPFNLVSNVMAVNNSGLVTYLHIHIFTLNMQSFFVFFTLYETQIFMPCSLFEK